jgi:poly(A) polymerase
MTALENETVPADSPESLLLPAVVAGQTSHAPEASLTAHVRAHAHRVLEVPSEVVYERLTAAFCGKFPHEAMQWLRDAGLLVHLLPELDATVEFSQEGGRRHKDVWEHTKTVTLQAVPSPAVRWAAVLHDIGKVPTRRFLPGGKVTFHGHAEVGVRMFRRGPAKRIAFPRALEQRIEELIRHHLRPGQYDGTWTDSAVRRFHRDMEPFLEDLLNLGRADVTSRRPGKRQQCLRSISQLSQRIRDLAALDAQPKPLPPGLGNVLMEQLDLPPGKHLAILRERLTQLVEDGSIEGGAAPDLYVQVVRERNLLEGIEIQAPRKRTRDDR